MKRFALIALIALTGTTFASDQKVVAWDIHQVLCTRQIHHGYECEPVEEVFDLVRELHANGVKQVIISNITNSSFKTLCSSYPDHFSLFDIEKSLHRKGFWKGIFIRKPHKRFYKKFFKKSGFNPEQVIFFDDKIENIKSAWKMNIKAIHFLNTDHARALLQEEGLL